MTEAALAPLDGVVAVEAAIAVAGLPGTRAARVAVLLEAADAGERTDPAAQTGADAVGAVVRTAIDALRAVHGPGVTGSIALARRGAGGAREPLSPRAVLAAAGLLDAAAAGDEVLFGPRTSWTVR
ncbi:hypothetical protein [Agrococcus carbonis]|uniref:Uncharacterized protein n=1 Tax=Agrococcus carbonis TaxID=684552 RepID=A0A1H1QKP4_9MICO|nr:hypothetical protein [Agrococcus carbonis]SDS24030.1 hypothetical protein SAMN04489719_1865 [Agrococcus carbonis]